MKPIYSLLILLACLCMTGCVRRTVTVEPKYGNPKTAERYGDSHTRHVENKTIWFWQDEYRNKGN